MAFMGWSAVRSNGAWFASKTTGSERYSSTGAVRVRKIMGRLHRDATKREAEAELVRMYRRGELD